MPTWAVKILMCQDFGKWPWEPIDISAHDWIVWAERWGYLKKIMNMPKDRLEGSDG